MFYLFEVYSPCKKINKIIIICKEKISKAIQNDFSM